MSVEKDHELEGTMHWSVIVPGHEERGAESSLFEHTKKELFKLPPILTLRPRPGRCFICDKTPDELGAPLEAHHFGIEWSEANAKIDWRRVREDFPHFPWNGFDPAHPMAFVDNMQYQGLLLCKKHHTGKDEGIHNMPFSLWLMQRYLQDGEKFSDIETIQHAPD